MSVFYRISISAIIFHICLILLMAAGYYTFYPERYIIYSLLTYLILSIMLRYLIARDHRHGVNLFRRKEYDKAIESFDRSHDFFTRHEWVDNFRFITMLSSSRIPFREMAHVNKAFCLARLDRRDEAKTVYRNILKENPANKIAEAALRMMEEENGSRQE